MSTPLMDLHATKVWLPGGACCLVFFGFYYLFPGYTNFGRYGPLFVSLPYLAVMPLVGAAGAYLSRLMKGSVVERILSALFPVFTFVGLFVVRIAYGLFFEGETYSLAHFLGGLVMTVIFSIVGGLLLVLGAWPFCFSRQFKPGDSSPA